eukprot:CAMPEP_0196665542 /NCGR_PEP_ID=MMETSP1086-20130531/61491_1 /TAXON_ID=77921 /ORGANISM="Cyanoptyche  gloeocystis , Strain SAG4.97" /LENGTH=91 /DNA_ID=CAMNT_0042002351 /DNA_START=164 /DNA_END=439 /DNA_ORIENTATION=-
MTVDRSSTTSQLCSRARATEARANRKSPARTATLFPNWEFADLIPRRVSAKSMTSSWTMEAVWIISVISANLRWLSKISSSDLDWDVDWNV